MMFYRNIEFNDYVLVIVPIFYCYSSDESLCGYRWPYFFAAIEIFEATDPKANIIQQPSKQLENNSWKGCSVYPVLGFGEKG